MSADTDIEILRLRHEINKRDAELKAWHDAFGTIHVSHAVERLRSAESRAALLLSQSQGQAMADVIFDAHDAVGSSGAKPVVEHQKLKPENSIGHAAGGCGDAACAGSSPAPLPAFGSKHWTFPQLPPDTHPAPRRIDIGWQCPVCQRVNSPHVTECRCHMMTPQEDADGSGVRRR